MIAVLGLLAVRVPGLLLLGFGGGSGGRCGGCGNWGGVVVVVVGDGLGRRVNSVSHFVKQQMSQSERSGNISFCVCGLTTVTGCSTSSSLLLDTACV